MLNAQLNSEIASVIITECETFYNRFRTFANNAKFHFEEKMWKEQRSANSSRQDVMSASIEACSVKIISLLGGETYDVNRCHAIKTYFAEKPTSVPFPILESFTAALEQVVAVENQRFQLECDTSYKVDQEVVSAELIVLEGEAPFLQLSIDVLNTPNFISPWVHYRDDVKVLQNRFEAIGKEESVSIDIFPNLFYRNKHAYLVGLITVANSQVPIAIAFINSHEGLMMDAVLTSTTEIIRIFEFTRSYFLVDTEDPEGLVTFLGNVMPQKKIEQLIINLGYQEWGKLLYRRNFNRQSWLSEQKLDHAPGIRGMVMLVFTLPDYPMVFKVIKGSFPYSKDTTRSEVVDKYRLIARHDRVGRLADTQLFAYWSFPTALFRDQLLRDLTLIGSPFVNFYKDEVILKQVFTERKMIPLNLFLEDAVIEEGEKAVIDYGNAIKELAMSNIFPGDLLIKNFGVTPDLRIVFYDYDEVVFVSACRFRTFPQPKDDEELWDADVREIVLPNDVFPEEWEKFLLPKGHYREVFSKHHSDIFSVEFWNYWKNFHLADGFIDLQPY